MYEFVYAESHPRSNSEETEMTQLRKRALWIVAIWTAVAVGFLVSFFSGGVETFADGSSRVLTGAIFLMIFVHLSTAITQLVLDLTTVALDVFLVCIGLWEAYREPGVVPVGWMWFLAYSTACGVFGTPIMLYLTRAQPGAEHLVCDERDDRLARKANLIGYGNFGDGES